MRTMYHVLRYAHLPAFKRIDRVGLKEQQNQNFGTNLGTYTAAGGETRPALLSDERKDCLQWLIRFPKYRPARTARSPSGPTNVQRDQSMTGPSLLEKELYRCAVAIQYHFHRL
jgi:hypothetical protein